MCEVIELRPRLVQDDDYAFVLEMPDDPVDACEAGMLSQLFGGEGSGSCQIHHRNTWMAPRLARGRRFNLEQTSEGWVSVSVEARGD